MLITYVHTVCKIKSFNPNPVPSNRSRFFTQNFTLKKNLPLRHQLCKFLLPVRYEITTKPIPVILYIFMHVTLPDFYTVCTYVNHRVGYLHK